MRSVIKGVESSSGIYKIENLVNGKCYIGSAVAFVRRFSSHKSMLNSGKHDNSHLQRAFNKYGQDAFVFSVVEVVKDSSVLCQREQYHLDLLRSQGIECYNMAFNAERYDLNQNKRKTYTLVDPEGQIRFFKNHLLSEVARIILHDVPFSKKYAGLFSVTSGRSKSYKGWRLDVDYDYENWRSNRNVNYKCKTYDVRLLSPDGDVFGPITNLNQFCRDHEIDNPSGILNLIRGRTRYINGWCLFDGTYNKPMPKGSKVFDVQLRSPNGELFGPIENLTGFCRDHQLNVTSIRELIAGKKKSGNYKGWTIPKGDQA